MNISIIGPEDSGKSRFAAGIAQKVARGRPVYIVGGERSQFIPIEVSQFHEPENAVVIIDDANAFLESYDLFKKDNHMKAPIIKARHRGRVNIFVFHSMDDAIKFMYRQSRYIYVSTRYKDSSYQQNRFLRGITPVEIGRGRWFFWRYKRY